MKKSDKINYEIEPALKLEGFVWNGRLEGPFPDWFNQGLEDRTIKLEFRKISIRNKTMIAMAELDDGIVRNVMGEIEVYGKDSKGKSTYDKLFKPKGTK